MYAAALPQSNILTINVKNFITVVRTQMHTLLIMHQILGFVDGSYPMPPMYVFDPVGFQQPNPSYAAWIQIDQCIRMWLFATVHQDLLTKVHELLHSFQIWYRLTNRFNATSLACGGELKCSLINLKKLKLQSMEDYLRHIKFTVDSLAAIQSPLSEIELIDCTILGLLKEYDILVAPATYFSGPLQLTFDDLQTKLIMYEQRLRHVDERHEEFVPQQAFMANGAKQGGGSSGDHGKPQNFSKQGQNNNGKTR